MVSVVTNRPMSHDLITIERTFNMGLVREVMTHPSIYPYVSDDGSPDPVDFEPLEHEGIYYLTVLDDEKNVLGLYLLHPHNTVLYEIHTCLLPTCRGKKADQAAQEVLNWIFMNTPCQKLITHVPVYNLPALHYAIRAGLTLEGTNRASFLKDGELYDQYLLGMKEDECPPPLQ